MKEFSRPDDLGQELETTYPDEHRRKMLRAMVLEICRTHDLNTPDIFFTSNALLEFGMERALENLGGAHHEQ